jgi:hypothetical protein
MEIWKDVPSYEGCYQVSNLGNVRSVDRIGRDGRGLRGKNLKKDRSTNGYLQVNLYHPLKHPRTLGIHRLVAWSFIGEQGDKVHVHHIDSNKENNQIDNLTYLTHRENTSLQLRNLKNGLPTGVSKTQRGYAATLRCPRTGKKYRVGTFKTIAEASDKYKEALRLGVEYVRSKCLRKKTSKYEGVRVNAAGNYQAYLRIDGKFINVGTYQTEDEAASERNIALNNIELTKNGHNA